MDKVSYAWAMLDVFSLTAIVALLELNRFSQFIMGDELNGINAILENYEEFHAYLPQQNVAFGIKPVLESGYWMFTALLLVANPLALFIMHAAIETDRAIDKLDCANAR